MDNSFTIKCNNCGNESTYIQYNEECIDLPDGVDGSNCVLISGNHDKIVEISCRKCGLEIIGR